jgi:ribose 5-phosphate isomerase A
MRYVLEGLGKRLGDGRLQAIAGVATSERTAEIARAVGIPLTSLDREPRLDLTVDGADEIDPALNLIKGLGGALLREKIVAAASDELLIVADDSKLVSTLGERVPVPVEVVSFGVSLVLRRLGALPGTCTLRLDPSGQPYVTDEGNHIVDYACGPILDAARLDVVLHQIPGVVEHGLFLGMASRAIVCREDGEIFVLERGTSDRT